MVRLINWLDDQIALTNDASSEMRRENRTLREVKEKMVELGLIELIPDTNLNFLPLEIQIPK